MSTRKKPAEPEVNQGLGYDTSDVQIGAVNKAMWMFFIATAAFIVAAMGIQYLLAGEVGPQKAAERRKLPPEPNPLLQSNVTAVQDMIDMRARERRGLTEYGVVDETKSVYKIPIERAIEIRASQMAQGATR